MNKQTTSISDKSGHPLEVEWNTYHPHIKMSDGTFLQVEQPKVTLVMPMTRFLAEEPRRVRLVDLSPRTALNLLTWLEGQRETLESLIRDEHE